MFTFANECTKHDEIIINSALWRFHQTGTTGFSIQGSGNAQNESTYSMYWLNN